MASLLAQIAEEAKRLIGVDGAILRLLRGDRLVAVGQRRQVYGNLAFPAH
jgi:hypothetical protein